MVWNFQIFLNSRLMSIVGWRSASNLVYDSLKYRTNMSPIKLDDAPEQLGSRRTRRNLGRWYSNGCTTWCKKTKCYRPTDTCCCRLCDEHSVDKRHLLTYPWTARSPFIISSFTINKPSQALYATLPNNM